MRGAAEPSMPRNLPPPEAPRSPSRTSVSPLSKCWHQLTCPSRGKGSICQSSLEIKAQVTSREWLLLMIKMGEGEALPISGLPLVGKGGDPEARARIGPPYCAERVGVDRTAGAFLPSPRPEPALRRRGRGQGPGPAGQLWGETGALAPSGAALRPTAGQDPCPSERRVGGRGCPCPKSFAHLVRCQDSKTHLMRQSDLLVISSCCVSFVQKLGRDV